MDSLRVKTALISVYDKSGLTELASFLQSIGVRIISSEGTARLLAGEQIPTHTFFPLKPGEDLLNGRVKTLDARIHAGILCDRSMPSQVSHLKELDIPLIDLVVVNFYPFHQIARQSQGSLEELIENIDIGGPAMMRAAAKNHASVLVLNDPTQYRSFVKHYQENIGTTSLYRKECAVRAFHYSFTYDQTVHDVLSEKLLLISPARSLSLRPAKTLRYGENPHQEAQLFGFNESKDKVSLVVDSKARKKSLSYNNLLDAHAAIWTLRCILDQNPRAQYATVVIKHGIPCGAAISDNAAECLDLAITTDELSAFGSIIAVSFAFDEECQKVINNRFIELILAPSFTNTSFLALSQKDNLQLLAIDNLLTGKLDRHSYRSIFGGMLVQTHDHANVDKDLFTPVTKAIPTEEELFAMELAFRIVKATPSNAIAIANTTRLLGIGAGQQNRIEALELAILRAKRRGFKLSTSALASDGFFPFTDCIELAKSEGIRLIIQPGGSMRDQTIINRADDLGIAMVFTNSRHFRH